MARLTRCWRSIAAFALVAGASGAPVGPAAAQGQRAALPPGAIAMRAMLADMSARDYRRVGEPFLDMEQRVLGLGTAEDVRALAESGNVRGQYLYGRVFEYGQLGVPASLAQAIPWYRRAVAGGDPHAQVALGFLVERGTGLPRNVSEAARLYGAAAAQNHARGQYNLAGFYRDGIAMPQNYTRAMTLFRQAAEQNYANAYASIAHLYEAGLGVTRDYGQAAAWARTGASLGSPQALRRYGIYLYEGLGVSRNQADGLVLIRRAAAAGDEFAQDYLRERNLSLQ